MEAEVAEAGAKSDQQEALLPQDPADSVQSTTTTTLNSTDVSEARSLGSRQASSNHGKMSAAASDAGLPPIHRQSSNLANRIAAFSSGVAPVRKGMTNADEDAITVEEVLHKLETAGRVNGQDRCDLPVPLVRSAHLHLVSARQDAAKTAKELAELKASRVQHIPPSTWIKREQKYKMDQEKYEHQIGQLRQRTEALEAELSVLRAGSNVQPLEAKIKELEHQLVAAAEEKTKVQSKFHELSIKHRQLIETSPQVATIWNEVLVQQAADGHNAAAMQRLVNFDLRHTAASPSVMPAARMPPHMMPSVSAVASAYSSGGPSPVPAGPHYGSSAGSKTAADVVINSEQSGPSTPMQQPYSSPAPLPPTTAGEQQQQPQTAEERAHALMAAVALEGLSPEASLAALQQLNYDLTMQLGCYQQMVLRLKDAMEQSDLEKAELEAEKMAMEMQLAGSSGRGWGSGLGFWRRSVGQSTGGPHPMEDLDEAGSVADELSVAGSISSRRSSMELDSSMLAAAVGGGGSNTATPTKAAAENATPLEPSEGSGEHSKAATDGSTQVSDQQKQVPAASASGGGGLFAARRQRASARAVAAADSLGKEVKELKRQVKSLQDENRYLVNTLVEIKMDLAETQSNHDQAKRALVRAMDKESCLDMKVTELRHMLDMATSLNQQHEQQGTSISIAATAAGAVAAAKAAVAAVTSGTPNSAKAAMAARQSPFGRAEPDEDSMERGPGAPVSDTHEVADPDSVAAQTHKESDAGNAEAENTECQPAASVQLSESSYKDADEEGAGSGGDASASSTAQAATAAGNDASATNTSEVAAAEAEEAGGAAGSCDTASMSK